MGWCLSHWISIRLPVPHSIFLSHRRPVNDPVMNLILFFQLYLWVICYCQLSGQSPINWNGLIHAWIVYSTITGTWTLRKWNCQEWAKRARTDGNVSFFQRYLCSPNPPKIAWIRRIATKTQFHRHFNVLPVRAKSFSSHCQQRCFREHFSCSKLIFWRIVALKDENKNSGFLQDYCKIDRKNLEY